MSWSLVDFYYSRLDQSQLSRIGSLHTSVTIYIYINTYIHDFYISWWWDGMKLSDLYILPWLCWVGGSGGWRGGRWFASGAGAPPRCGSCWRQWLSPPPATSGSRTRYLPGYSSSSPKTPLFLEENYYTTQNSSPPRKSSEMSASSRSYPPPSPNLKEHKPHKKTSTNWL